MQPHREMYLVWQDLGLQLNRLTTPQPLGFMTQDHQMTTETHDEDLKPSQVPKMNDHEVSSKEMTQWIRSHWENILSEFCKADPCQSDLF